MRVLKIDTTKLKLIDQPPYYNKHTMSMPIDYNPHSAHDRTKEWDSCCMEIVMGRDPKRQRLMVCDDESDSDHNNEEDNKLLGCWSSPNCLAINMIQDEINEYDDEKDVDSWMKAATTLSESIDEVSILIQRKSASYVSSTDTLNICFNNNNSTEQTMTNADRSMLETTVATFAAGMTKQIDSLRQTVIQSTPDNNINDTTSTPQQQWASGPIGHRTGIASCLMQRLKSEIMEPMTSLQKQREKSQSKINVSGTDASDIANNPMRLLGLGKEDSHHQRSLPPAPWEVGEHNTDRDRAERNQEKDEFLDVYFDNEERSKSGDNTTNHKSIPPSVARLMDVPQPSVPIQKKQPQPIIQKPLSTPQPQQQMPYEEGNDEHMDQLHRESAAILATYQHSDLEGVQKVERSMVEITSLLSRFTDLIQEQQEDIFMIHDQAVKSKENVDKGQDNLVDAANRGDKSKHPMATFIFFMALLLLFFNWILR